jgi:hypothetical protein
MRSKTTVSMSLFLMLSLSVSAHADFNQTRYVVVSEHEEPNEDKISSKSLANDEFFLGFEAPLFESIQSQWGTLISNA